jgi:type I restriction enzyme S subunit
MSSWVTKALQDVLTLQRGHDLPTGQRVKGPVPVISSGDVAGWHNEAKSNGPGVILGRATNIGVPKWCEGPYWPLNTTLYVTDFKGNDPKFIFHMFQVLDLSGFDSGSVQPMLNRNYIAQVPIQIPDIAEQRRIAGVLGALDDLIEVNRGLVANLDAVFRAGWKSASSRTSQIISFGKVAEATKGMSYKGAFLADDGLPMINMGSFGVDGTYREEGLKYYNEGEVKANRRLVRDDLVIVNTDLTQSRDILARPIIVPFEIATSTHHTFQVSVPGGDAQRFWLYCALREESVRQRLISYATGTTVAALPLDALVSQELPWAGEAAIEQWWLSTKSLYASQLDLLEENRDLIRVRDELLPLLMSGRVRVSEVVAA